MRLQVRLLQGCSLLSITSLEGQTMSKPAPVMSADPSPKGHQPPGAGAIVTEPTFSRRVPTGQRCLRLPQVEDRTGLKETAIREKVKLGDFPAPFKLGARAVAWLEADVDAWIADRAAKRVLFAIPPTERGSR
jgi:prophage regulatory protein